MINPTLKATALGLALISGLAACSVTPEGDGAFSQTYNGQEVGRWGEINRSGFPVRGPQGQPVAPPGR